MGAHDDNQNQYEKKPNLLSDETADNASRLVELVNAAVNISLKFGVLAGFGVIAVYASQEGITFPLLEGEQTLGILTIIVMFAFFSAVTFLVAYLVFCPFGVLLVWLYNRHLKDLYNFLGRPFGRKRFEPITLQFPSGWWICAVLGLVLAVILLLPEEWRPDYVKILITIFGCGGCIFAILHAQGGPGPIMRVLFGLLLLFPMAFFIGDLFRPLSTMSLRQMSIRSSSSDMLIIQKDELPMLEVSARQLGITLEICPFDEDHVHLLNAQIVWRYSDSKSELRVYDNQLTRGFVTTLPVQRTRRMGGSALLNDRPMTQCQGPKTVL